MGKLDENDLFEMYGGVEGIKKDPKILKEWLLAALEAYGKDPKFPVGMPMPIPKQIRFTEEELEGTGWMILDNNGPIPDWDRNKPDGLIGQSVIKRRNV